MSPEAITGQPSVTNVQYHVNERIRRNYKSLWRGLVDRGANGGIAGLDSRVIQRTGRYIDLSGVDDHTVRNLEIVTAGATVDTHMGPIIIVMNQYACMQDRKTIHSPIQMEHYKIQVKEKAPDVTGKVPTITLLEGYKIPLSIRNGLSYMKQRCFTDDEWRTLPKVPITSVTEWNPKVMDSTVPDEWYHSQPKVLRGLDTANYDKFGEYKLTSKDDADGA